MCQQKDQDHLKHLRLHGFINARNRRLFYYKPKFITATRNSLTNITARETSKQKKEGKQQYVYFKRQTAEISQVKTKTGLQKVNLKRNTESLRIAAQNNTIRSNYIKANLILHNWIASVSYVDITTKRLI